MTQEWFVALDGDDVGRRLEQCMLLNDLKSLREFTQAFECVVQSLLEGISSVQGSRVVLAGGDSILLTVDEPAVPTLLAVIKKALLGTEFTFSGGCGPTMRAAYLSLKLAKTRGKNRIEGPLGGGRTE